MASGICFKFDASHNAVMVLLVLQAIVVLLLIPWVLVPLSSCSGKVQELFVNAALVILCI